MFVIYESLNKNTALRSCAEKKILAIVCAILLYSVFQTWSENIITEEDGAHLLQLIHGKRGKRNDIGSKIEWSDCSKTSPPAVLNH